MSNDQAAPLSQRDRIERDGFALADPQLPEDSILAAVAALENAAPATGKAGRRNVAREIPEIERLARSPELHGIVREVLGAEPFVVRVLLFDKTPGANWAVGWHQDPAIAVREQIETPGFSGWSLKAGVLHVHPPAEVLARMLTLRLHLDPCDINNGPLRVIPGSHRSGRLTEAEIQHQSSNSQAVSCISPRGGLLAMRPLLLHASSPATHPNHRRVLHLEFACDELPSPLQWHEQLRGVSLVSS